MQPTDPKQPAPQPSKEIERVWQRTSPPDQTSKEMRTSRPDQPSKEIERVWQRTSPPLQANTPEHPPKKAAPQPIPMQRNSPPIPVQATTQEHVPKKATPQPIPKQAPVSAAEWRPSLRR